MDFDLVWITLMAFGALIALGLVFEAMLAVVALAVTLPVWGARRLWRAVTR